MVREKRSKYNTYLEYHISADAIGNLVTAKGLQGTLDLHKSIFDIIEHNFIPKCMVNGEPQLSARELYPLIMKNGSSDVVKTGLNFISYCNGQHSLLDIEEKCEVSFECLVEEIELFLEHGLVKLKN